MILPQNEIKKIAVFRALQLGDMLCSIPALRALRQHFPEAHICLLSLPWAKFLVEGFPQYLDEFIHFPGYPGLPEQSFDPRAFHDFLGQMLEQKFDLVLQMQGNGSIVNPMVELFGARYTAGFRLPDDYAPNNNFFLTYPNGIHEIERHLRLMQHLGIADTITDLEFPIYPKDEEDLSNADLRVERKKYVCVHPGSRGSWRQWPTKYFAALADYCHEQEFKVVLTGTKEELPIVDEVMGYMKHEPLIAAGKTSIGAAAVLIRDALLLISNCTGVSHIAAALKTPSIVLSMDGEPERWAPLNKNLHRTIDWTKTPQFALVFDSLKDLLCQISERDHFRDNQIVTAK